MPTLRSLGNIRVWIVLLSGLKSVSLQMGNVNPFIEEDALLPCLYSNAVPEKVTIYWRDKNDKHVLDIEDNSPQLDTQDPKFKGRVQSYPDQYKTGNFSITLKNVTLRDNGVYECNIRNVEGRQQVNLTVTGERPRVEVTPSPRNGASAVISASVLLPAGLSVLLHNL